MHHKLREYRELEKERNTPKVDLNEVAGSGGGNSTASSTNSTDITAAAATTATQQQQHRRNSVRALREVAIAQAKEEGRWASNPGLVNHVSIQKQQHRPHLQLNATSSASSDTQASAPTKHLRSITSKRRRI